MKIMIDMGHPAHVHFWKNFIWEMEKKGHEFKVIVREKDTLTNLLNHYNIPYTSIGEAGTGTFGKAVKMFSNDAKILKIAKEFKPDVLAGIGSPYVAQVGKITRKPSVIFTDTEHATLINKLTVPFATKILTPSCFLNDYGEKHVRYNGFHELAYLHPKRFKDKGIGKRNIIIRLSSWQASHDTKKQTFDQWGINKIKTILSDYGNVTVSREGMKTCTLDKNLYYPEHMHRIMKNAKLYIGDGATMATESALLGVPSIYISPLAGTMGNHIDLEQHGLMRSYNRLPIIDHILDFMESGKEVRKMRDNMLKDKIDVTKFMIDYFEEMQWD